VCSSPELKKALEFADARLLSAVLTCVTGDVHTVPDTMDRPDVVELAMQLLPPVIDGSVLVPALTDEVLQVAMERAAGEPVPSKYRPFVREQMMLGPIEPALKLEVPDDASIVIVGAGASGLALAHALDRAGVTSFTILDKNPEPGGTWWQNRYPGCRVDTPSLLYSFTFDPDPGWPNHFSFQPDLLNYMKKTAAPFLDRIVSGAEVQRLTWEDDLWRVEYLDADGQAQTQSATIVIGATGFLHVSKYPAFPGMNAFYGPSFHSSEWNDIDLHGKRVAVIGTGASANQIVPAIVNDADRVLVFQRSAHWVVSHPNYDQPLEGTSRWLIDHVPTYLNWFRFRQFWMIGDGLLAFMRIDPHWSNQERSVNELNDRVRARATEYIHAQLAMKPELIEVCTPDFPPYAQRMIVDNGWYSTLCRDDVDLVSSPIQGIEETGVRTTDGLHEVDVIIYATGFETNHVLGSIDIRGRNGVNVRERLDSHPRAYLGMALEDCPNLFITSGPNGVPVHGGAGTLTAECQASYIIHCLQQMFDHGWTSIEIAKDALHQFVQATEAENRNYVWSLEGISNWFKGSVGTGSSVALPWAIVDLWAECRNPDVTVFNRVSRDR
jgi:4-hydroxyacetophenone monooxygenase